MLTMSTAFRFLPVGQLCTRGRFDCRDFGAEGNRQDRIRYVFRRVAAQVYRDGRDRCPFLGRVFRDAVSRAPGGAGSDSTLGVCQAGWSMDAFRVDRSAIQKLGSFR